MHFRPFKKKKKNLIFPISMIFEIFWSIFFLTICLILGFPPLWNPRIPHGSPIIVLTFNLSILKIGKK